MAMLDAICEPDARLRHHHFDAHWSARQQLASMENGGGDEYSIVFSEAGAYIRGFDHESPMSPFDRAGGEPWPGVIDDVPEVFRSLVEEPAFGLDGTPKVTACLWREAGDERWRAGEVDYDGSEFVPDGAEWLFGLLVGGSPEKYQDWAEGHFGVPVDLAAVRHVYRLRPLTPAVVSAVNPELTLDQLDDTIAAIGYPPYGA